jgi:methylation protein EvaC
VDADLRRGTCAGCDGPLEDFLDLGTSPLADRFPADPGDPETWYPLQVAVCPACWLVQLREVVPDEDLYGADYGFSTGTSPSSAAYFKGWAGWALDRFPGARWLTVEIACNDGTLLRHFAEVGCPVLGVDPAGPSAQAAVHVPVITEPFTAKLGAELAELHGPAGLVIACNVAAHVADPHDFLTGIAGLLHPDGRAVAEFQYLGDLIAGGQYDHMYHEHRFFYSLRSFTGLARRAGLAVTSWERTPAQGGSLRVVLRKDTGGAEPAQAQGENWLRRPGTYTEFAGRVAYSRTRLLELLDAELGAGRTVAGFAASAKSATLLNYCGIGPDRVAWIEDTTPAKQGRYTPGSHIPVVAPGARIPPPDVFLLTAWNYLPGVIRREKAFLDGGGRFLVPGALPVII